MAIKTWKAKVRLSNGTLQDVTMRADNYSNAKAMLESEYGKKSVVLEPQEVR
jgi:hypothetical protein